MKCPAKTLTKIEGGKTACKVLVDEGRFVRYSYIDTDTGRVEERYSIILDNGKEKDHYFIEQKHGKEEITKRTQEKESRKRKIWDSKQEKIIEF
ncbi:MAG: hypothetical protein R6U32_06845 [Candidatus Woesearchaeota archaeon]